MDNRNITPRHTQRGPQHETSGASNGNTLGHQNSLLQHISAPGMENIHLLHLRQALDRTIAAQQRQAMAQALQMSTQYAPAYGGHNHLLGHDDSQIALQIQALLARNAFVSQGVGETDLLALSDPLFRIRLLAGRPLELPSTTLTSLQSILNSLGDSNGILIGQTMANLNFGATDGLLAMAQQNLGLASRFEPAAVLPISAPMSDMMGSNLRSSQSVLLGASGTPEQLAVGSSVAAPREKPNPPPNAGMRKKRVYAQESFPEKLFQLMEAAEAEGRTDLISFSSSGQAIFIHRAEALSQEFIPRFFRHSSIQSFKRQMRMYGFRKVTQGPEAGSFAHKLFIRGRPDLAKEIRRSSDSDP